VSGLFTPLRLRGLTLPNRVWVSPMCQYSATAGMPGDWHLVHLGQYVLGGAGLVLTEATAVTAAGRISPQDTGLWDDAQVPAWRRVTSFVHGQGGRVGVQLAHAGRKASTRSPWRGGGAAPAAEGGWEAVGPTTEPFAHLPAPRLLSAAELAGLTADFAAATRRAEQAGFDVVELHFAHGYLAHQLYSPLVNTRTDRYGGDFDGRTRWLLETAEAVRAAWPADRPLLARISATDWAAGGWTVGDSVRLAKLLAECGIDLVDCSSGGAVPGTPMPAAPGFQVPLAETVRLEAGVPVAAVGLVTEPAQAERIVETGQADAVLLGRALLRDPYWPRRAARELGVTDTWPVQYERARP
jgi:2,4-dienoyl-CoA reductase-like NADH-dependent reductase (Old Yellow Enzyme family)